jgi:hypothetical protein
MKNLIKPLAFLTGFILLFAACKKDFTTLSISGWHPQLAAPLFSTEITLRNVIGNDTSIETQADSALVFVYHQDSVFSVEADSLLQWNDNSNYTFNFSLGILQVDNFAISDSISMNDVLPSLNPDNADTLRKYDGQVTYYPPFGSSQEFLRQITGIDNFQQLHFSSGSLQINIQNTLPVKLDTLFYDLVDLDNGSSLAQIRITDLLPGTQQNYTLNLSDKTISSSLEIKIIQIKSSGSYPDKVLINLNNGLRFQVTSSNLEVISGTAKIPSQSLFSEQKIIDFNLQEGAEIKQIQFESGSFDYNINSSMDASLNVHLTLPSAQQNNTIPTKDIQIPANGNISGNWDISNMSMDLSTDNLQAFNRIPISFQTEISESNQFISFDSSNQITAQFQTSNIRLASATGYLGQQQYSFNPDSISIDLDFLKKLKGELVLDDPEMSLNYKNGFGVPLQANINFVALNLEKGSSQPLNLAPISFLSPSIMGQNVYGTVTIDKNNSSIVDFLSLRPDQINYSGSLVTNPNGRESNFVSRDASFTASADIRIPLILQANQLQFSDTITDLRISKEDFPAESGTIKAIVNNGFPIEVKMQLSFPDSITGQTLTTLDFGKIASATVDQSGKVSSPAQSELNIEIGKDFFDKVGRANTGIIHVETTTFNNGDVPVQLFSDYKFKVSVGISATITP